MREGAVPEHPDLARERKRDRWAILFGLGGVIIFFGVGLWIFAAYAQYYYWKGRTIPPEVQASINQECALGYLLLGIGAAVMLASYVVWRYLRWRAEPTYET